jgi:hypothetical protein
LEALCDRRKVRQVFLSASYRLNGRINGLVPLHRPAGLGYKLHTWRVTCLGCQKLNLEPVCGLRYGHRSGVTATTKVRRGSGRLGRTP